jgi:hypothetical protein
MTKPAYLLGRTLRQSLYPQGRRLEMASGVRTGNKLARERREKVTRHF